MSKFYVIGDTHGRLDMLVRSLKDWDSDSEQLILLGDYIDYGPDSFGVIREVKNLVDKYGAIALKGNHEEYFSKMIQKPNSIQNLDKNWHTNGRKETFKSFLQVDTLSKESFGQYRSEILDKRMKYIEFMDELPHYAESETFIFAHAGINLYEQGWRLDEMAMIDGDRRDFLKSRNQTNKIIVFGHIRTGIIRGTNKGIHVKQLHKMPFLDDRIWIDETGTKLGIDGGNVFGGYLHGVHLDEHADKLFITSVGQDLQLNHGELYLNKEFNRLVV